jgi:hypothetical protein
MSSNGGTDGQPLRVTLDQQRLADALVRALSGNNVSLHAENGSWIVSIDGATTDQLVVHALNAIRDTLARRPSASALVELDGREYVMRSEDHPSRRVAQASTPSEIAEPRSDAALELPPQAQLVRRSRPELLW